jgi:hypothetical protein
MKRLVTTIAGCAFLVCLVVMYTLGEEVEDLL